MKRITCLLIVLATTAAYAEIKVNGVGKAEAPPDLALTTFNFTVRDTNLSTLADTGQKKLAALTNQLAFVTGIVNFAVGYQQVNEANSYSSSREGMPKIFERTYSIQLQTKQAERDAMRVAQFGLDNGLTLTGVYRFSSDGLVIFALEDFQATYLRALRAALDNARSHAETVAGLTGLTVGQIKNVVVERSANWNSPKRQGFEFTSNEPDRVEIEVNVTVTFDTAARTPKQ